MATCTRCKKNMDIKMFTKPNGKVLKRCERCRAASRAAGKAYYQTHKEERNAYNQAYKEKKKACLKAYYKDYNQAHKEKRNAYSKAYSKTPAGIKTGRIGRWKVHGIIFTDVEAFYDRYLAATHCEHCSANFKDSQDRHADHDHSITDGPNIRGILCRSCNLRDVLKDCPVKE